MDYNQKAATMNSLFETMVNWNRALGCYQASNRGLNERLEIHQSDGGLSGVTGSGQTIEAAINDLWPRLTELPEGERIRIGSAESFLVWIEYCWNGSEFVEVERRGC